jgi:raffinose/stachyose/melibiose transport system permease protein
MTAPTAFIDRAGRRPRGRSSWRNYLYLLPALVLMGMLIYYSVGYTVWLSTFQWNGIGPDRVFVGVGNYLQVLKDPAFARSLLNVAIFFLLVFVQMALGFTFALVLHSRVRLAIVYKVLLFLPVVLAPAVIAPAFQQIFAVDGELNQILGSIGLGALQHAWLADPGTALWVLATIAVWGGTGFSFVMYFAGLTQIDHQVLEAARVDGASNLRTVAQVILPMMRTTTVTLIVLGTIGTIKTFDIPQIITQGGPADSTQFLATYIYQQGVSDYNAGYGAALTIVLIAACLIFTIAQLRLQSRGAQDA